MLYVNPVPSRSCRVCLPRIPLSEGGRRLCHGPEVADVGAVGDAGPASACQPLGPSRQVQWNIAHGAHGPILNRALHAPELVQILAAVVRVDDAADLLFELGPPGDVSFSRLSTIMLCAVRHRAVTYIVVASPNQQRPPMPFCRPRHISIPVLDQAASRPRVRSGPLAT